MPKSKPPGHVAMSLKIGFHMPIVRSKVTSGHVCVCACAFVCTLGMQILLGIYCAMFKCLCLQMTVMDRNREQLETLKQLPEGEGVHTGVVHKEEAAIICSVITIIRTRTKQLLGIITERTELCGNKEALLYDVLDSGVTIVRMQMRLMSALIKRIRLKPC